MSQTCPHSPGGIAASVTPAPPDVRVVSIPAGHPYPARITAADGIILLADPRPDGAPAGQWWPPVALDPAWIREHAADADVLHIHFGTESFTPEHLTACIAAAHEAGWPVVYTVHDLEHPQLVEQGGYREQLDVLVPGADALVTLTAGAAAEITRRWGRAALVTPHPAVLDDSVLDDNTELADNAELAASEDAQPASSTSSTSPSLRIGMHLKDLRSNIDAVGMVTALGAAADRLAAAGRDVVAEVRIHTRVRDDATRDAVRMIAAGHSRVELVEHNRLDDAGLAIALAGLDVCVLPYQHGTHSGWLELCWDLAVGVAAPEVGFYAEQHTDGSVASFEAEPTGESLAAAIATVVDTDVASRPGTAARRAEMQRRRAVRVAESESLVATHAALYRDLLRERRS